MKPNLDKPPTDVFERDVEITEPKFGKHVVVKPSKGASFEIETIEPEEVDGKVVWMYSGYGTDKKVKESELTFVKNTSLVNMGASYDSPKGSKMTIVETEYAVVCSSGSSMHNTLYFTNTDRTRLYVAYYDPFEQMSKVMDGEDEFGEASKSKRTPPEPKRKFANPQDLALDIRQVVIGQEDALRAMAIAGYDQLVRPDGTKKSNVLIMGPTGCGKTELARTASKLIGVPFGEVKLSNVSTTGYKGSNLGEELSSLGKQSDKPGFYKSVVLLDELDKLAPRNVGNDRQGFGPGLQNELIGWIESATVGGERFGGIFGGGVKLDTTEMLFVCTGAFVGLDEIIAQRLSTNVVSTPVQELYAQAILDDFVEYGIKPELMGRLPIITFVRPLTAEDMVLILKNGEKSALKQEVLKLQEGYGLAVEIEEGVYEIIAQAAVQKGTGARSLETITNDLFVDVKWNIQEYASDSTLRINTELAKKILARYLEPIKKNGGQIGFKRNTPQ